jgi:hypothetical protein
VVLVGHTACSLILSSLDYPFGLGFDSRLPPYVDSHPTKNTRFYVLSLVGYICASLGIWVVIKSVKKENGELIQSVEHKGASCICLSVKRMVSMTKSPIMTFREQY